MTSTTVIKGYADRGFADDPYTEGVNSYNIGMQVTTIGVRRRVGMQVSTTALKVTGMQVQTLIYNTTQLRILCEFPSRGTPALLGQNWTASSEASGDFEAWRVNTDIPEEVFRSIVADDIYLTCDTGLPQGVFLDTLAILNHNISISGSVTLQGADVSDFSTVGVSIPLTVEEDNMFYIAPTVPTSGYRYWRLAIDDPTNADGYIQIGIVVFGAASIITTYENFENPLRHGRRHFKDEIETEGFTRVMNDRAMRRYLSLTFANLQRSAGNIETLEAIFDEAKTSLKCLWIPTPQTPSRYSVFGKLRDLPDISTIDHGSDDESYSSLTIDVDESL